MQAPAPQQASHKRLALIAALAANRTIGQAGGMPWHLPQDLRFFKQKTMGHRILMGRRTWESLPGPLPGRAHVVISRQPLALPEGVVQATSLEAALALPSLDCPAVGLAQAAIANLEPTVFVIGGGQIYQQALPLATDLYLTEIGQSIAGDTQFPQWPHDQFVEVSREPFEAALSIGGPQVPVAFVHYRRSAGFEATA